MTAVSVEKPIMFRSGWFCKRCDRVTEHVQVKGGLKCTVCGFSKRKEEGVKAKQKEAKRRFRERKLEKRLQALKKEAVS
jgi:ribosomal protein L37E